MTATSGDGWMSGPEAAKLLGVQLHTLHKMIDRGELVADVVPLDQVRRRRAIRSVAKPSTTSSSGPG